MRKSKERTVYNQLLELKYLNNAFYIDKWEVISMACKGKGNSKRKGKGGRKGQ